MCDSDEEITESCEPSRARKAQEYEAAGNRLFLIRTALTVVLLAVYLLSGASSALAQGLQSRFGDAWWLVNGVYSFITVFEFAAIMFPLTLYGDFVLERWYGLLRQSLDGWFLDYLKSLLIELLLAVFFFEIVYVFLRYVPNTWWLWATVFYVLLAVVLTSIAPVVIMPLFHKFEPLEDVQLTEAVKQFAEKEGLKVVGVYRWGLEAKTSTANAALTGMGRTRRIVLGDTMLSGYSPEEIMAVLAHEVGHYKNRDIARLIVVGASLAAAGFYVAHLILKALTDYFGFAGIDDIGSLPILLFCLFVFSLVTMPFSNMYSRRREYAADAYAVRAVGSAEPLVSALEKLADQNLADRDPAAWIEFLLHSHPSIARRVARARDVGRYAKNS